MLNRERVAAGLSLLVLVFALASVLDSGLAPPSPRISTEIPPFTQEIPRIEPRLYLDDSGGDRNPFQLASDWAPITPELLEPPPPEPSRWLVVPLGRSPDPTEVGYLYLEEPPAEVKPEGETGDAEEKKP